MKKTFKIGEYAVGGIVEAIIQPEGLLRINFKDWNTNELVTNYVAPFDNEDIYRSINDFLNNNTSIYYSDNILDWIKTKGAFVPHVGFKLFKNENRTVNIKRIKIQHS